MPIVTKSELKYLIEYNKLITAYKDLDVQLQPAGFDVTLDKVEKPNQLYEGSLTFNSKLVPKTAPLLPEHRFGAIDLLRLPPNVFNLNPGRTYLLFTNEVFNMPFNMTAFGFARSSLTRMGTLFASAVVDAGYTGHLSFVIYTAMSLALEKDCRFAQVVFFEHRHTEPYKGSYKEPLHKLHEPESLKELLTS